MHVVDMEIETIVAYVDGVDELIIRVGQLCIGEVGERFSVLGNLCRKRRSVGLQIIRQRRGVGRHFMCACLMRPCEAFNIRSVDADEDDIGQGLLRPQRRVIQWSSRFRRGLCVINRSDDGVLALSYTV